MFVSARRIAAELGRATTRSSATRAALVGDPDTGEMLLHRPLEVRLAREILRALARGHARPSNVYVDDELYVTEANDEASALRRRSPASSCTSSATSRAGSRARPPSSSPWATRARWTRCATRLQAALRRAARSSRSRCRYFLEFAAPGVSKASGARARRPTGSASRPAEAIAFGDGENDRELLEWAALGVAVANADERLIARGRLGDPLGARRRRRPASSRRSPLPARRLVSERCSTSG